MEVEELPNVHDCECLSSSSQSISIFRNLCETTPPALCGDSIPDFTSNPRMLF